MLDDKLREILSDIEIGANFNYDEWIPKIKQAFADEGYKREWSADNTFATPRKVLEKLPPSTMTGQQWYNKLMKEFLKVNRLYENDDDWLAKYSDFVEAAKKVIQ